MSSDRYDTTFVESGTLVTPGWIGRLIRLGLGLALMKFFYDLLRFEILMDRGDTGLTSSQAPDQVWFWVLRSMALLDTPIRRQYRLRGPLAALAPVGGVG